jgi:hypothetical protein
LVAPPLPEEFARLEKCRLPTSWDAINVSLFPTCLKSRFQALIFHFFGFSFISYSSTFSKSLDLDFEERAAAIFCRLGKGRRLGDLLTLEDLLTWPAIVSDQV